MLPGWRLLFIHPLFSQQPKLMGRDDAFCSRGLYSLTLEFGVTHAYMADTTPRRHSARIVVVALLPPGASLATGSGARVGRRGPLEWALKSIPVTSIQSIARARSSCVALALASSTQVPSSVLD